MTLTRRITIRMSQEEYDKITAYCLDTDQGYSELFMMAIQDQVSDLPQRNFQSGERTAQQLISFHETLAFYNKRITREPTQIRVHDRRPDQRLSTHYQANWQ